MTNDTNETPEFPGDPDGHTGETYYNANPPATDAENPLRQQSDTLESPSASPSAYPDYTEPTKTSDSLGGTSLPTDDKWKVLPLQEDWESLGVGSTITRTAEGWDVIKKVTAGGGFAHGAGRSIKRAFQTIGASYDMSDGSRKLVDAAGEPIPAEDESTTK